MTEQRAIEKLNMLDEALNFQRHDADECSLALHMAIEALAKQIPKKPLTRYENMGFGISPNETFKIYGCPCCKEDLGDETSYCQNCGQKIDWGESE